MVDKNRIKDILKQTEGTAKDVFGKSGHQLRAYMQKRKTNMDKNAKKKAASGSKGSKPQSDYKSREAEGKNSQADSKFQKQIGKAKDTLRKG
ncbi:MAG: hypothetical protein JJU40_17010 [Rhodobacteraceae bacterium]|nr:hypothetical protein [Paracoccaceae bacterium]